MSRKTGADPAPALGFMPPPPAAPVTVPTVEAVPAVPAVVEPAAAETAPAASSGSAPAETAPAEETAAAVRAPAASTRPARKPAASGRRRRKRRTDPEEEGTGVSLPMSLRRRLRAFQRLRGGTYTNITLDAVEATHDRLADLLRPPTTDVTVRSGPLFAGRTPRRVHASDDLHGQVNLRFSMNDLATIDEIAEEVKAPNRSAMLAAALGAYLPPIEELEIQAAAGT